MGCGGFFFFKLPLTEMRRAVFLSLEIYKAAFATVKENARGNVLNDSSPCAAAETKMDFENLLSSLTADLEDYDL